MGINQENSNISQIYLGGGGQLIVSIWETLRYDLQLF